MVKVNLYEYWGFLVNDRWEVVIPEGAIPLMPLERGSKKPRILCLVPKDVATELEKDEGFIKKWVRREPEEEKP